VAEHKNGTDAEGASGQRPEEEEAGAELKPAAEPHPAGSEVVSAEISAEHPPAKEHEAEQRFEEAVHAPEPAAPDQQAAGPPAQPPAQPAQAPTVEAALEQSRQTMEAAAAAAQPGAVPEGRTEMLLPDAQSAQQPDSEAEFKERARHEAEMARAEAATGEPGDGRREAAAQSTPEVGEQITATQGRGEDRAAVQVGAKVEPREAAHAGPADAVKPPPETPAGMPAAAKPAAAEKPAAAAKPAAEKPAAAAKPAAEKPAAAAKPAAAKKPAKPKEPTAPEREPDDYVKQLAAAHPDKVVEAFNRFEENTVVATPEGYHALCQTLRDDPALRFDYLALLSGIHYVGAEARFEVALDLYSMQYNRRLRVKVKLDHEQPELETVVDLWPTANWHEREAYDFFGIRFRNHPDQRRILMPDYWTGHPLRKDYPWRGYREQDEARLHERIVHNPLTVDELPEASTW
jgi:NADH-quinone oxidoreductase subunit C